MILFLFLLLLIIIIFPFPINLKLYYDNNVFFLKFLFFKINLKNKNFKRKEKKYNFDKIKILKNLSCSKFKPSASFNIKIFYSCKDAMLTSITYGLLCSLYSYIVSAFSIPFNLNKFLYNVTPHFEDKYIVKFELSSIIFISAAQIIYIIYLIKKR